MIGDAFTDALTRIRYTTPMLLPQDFVSNGGKSSFAAASTKVCCADRTAIDPMPAMNIIGHLNT
jgi:hypothetical protein